MEDLQVLDDIVGWVRENPERFLRNTPVTGADLAARVVHAALQVGVSSIDVRSGAHWWLIGSSTDWLSCGRLPPALEGFWRIVRFPEAGPNSMRPEILLTAFATEVFTVAGETVTQITGDGIASSQILASLAGKQEWARTIGFTLRPAERTTPGAAE